MRSVVITRRVEAPRERLLSLHARWPERYPALLESVARGAPGRYDILFAFPLEVLRATSSGSFLNAFDWALRQKQSEPVEASLPFTGGWFVFLGYEVAVEIEPRLVLPVSPDGVTALALRIPAALVYDQRKGAMHVLAEAGRETLLDEMERDLDSQEGPAPCPAHSLYREWGSLFEEEPSRFLESVKRAQRYIEAGDVYQVNLSRTWSVQLNAAVTPADIYRRLCASNPAPFAASLVVDDVAILSSSPERLFSVRHGPIGAEVETRPIAGTRPRSRVNGNDAAECAALIAHPKERAEHLMLVDLERNDLGKICVPGSVRVDDLMAVESYAHVHHLVSSVRGRVRREVTLAGVLRAVFPGGTITGCPKIRCMQIIAELEGVGRGAYTGSLGYVNRDGSGDFNILIRTLTHRPSTGEVRFRAGAGIVADSDPERELEETRAKARGLLRAFGAGE